MARREQLLDDLTSLFVAEGFLHLRIGALASRLKCSRSTLYELADSKDELFTLVVERFVDGVARRAADSAEALNGPSERIARFFEVLAEGVSVATPAFWRDVQAFGPTQARFEKTRSWGVGKVQSYLDDGIARGVFRRTNTPFLAHVLWMAARAARDVDLLESAGLDTRTAMREIGELLLHGVDAAR